MTLDEIDELVSDIRQLLVSESPAFEVELIDLAGRHEDFVIETTKWLKSVDALLQKGLRTEAIELAEREPNLNEVVIALDFPELDAWNDLLCRFDMQPIRALPEGIAADLNDAYSMSGPLEQLLQKHRTAALARAPIAQRLQILRRLATADKENPVWNQDVREFEKFRLSEVRSELDTAVKYGDLNTVVAVSDELHAEVWAVAVPVELKRRASDAKVRMLEETSFAAIEDVAYELSDMFAVVDLASAKKLYRRFNELNEIVKLPQTDALMDIAGPALDWVKAELLKEEQEQHHQMSIAALEAGINNGSTAPELEGMYVEATRHGHVLPDVLQLRLSDRLESLRAIERRRRRLFLGISIASLVIVFVATGFVVQQLRIRSAIGRHKVQLASLLDAGRKSGAIQPLEKYFDLLSTEPASICNSAELVSLREQYERLRGQEESRKKQMTELLTLATATSEKATVPGDFSEALNALKAAESASLNETERTEVLKVEVAVRQRLAEVQKTADDAFQLKLNDVIAKSSELPADKTEAYDPVLNEIGSLVRVEDISPRLVESARSLQAKVLAQKEEIRLSLDVARSLQDVSRSVGDPDGFLKELGRYVEQYPGTTRATDFAQVSDSERDLIAGAVQWNKMRATLLGIDFKKISSAEAKQIVDEFSDFQTTSGPYAGDMLLSDRLLMLQAVMKRKPLVDGFKLVLGGKAVTSAFMIETPDGRERYYTDSSPLVDKGLTFDSYTTPGGDQTVNKKLSLGSFPDAAERPRDSWLSPQTRLARVLIERAEGSGSEDFEGMIRYAIDRVLSDEPKLDPILRMLLAERVLEYGAEGSHFIAVRSRKVLASFAEGGVPRLTNWVNFADVQNRKLRDVATEFIQKQSEEILEAVKSAEMDRDAAQKIPIGREAQWIGWLCRDDKLSGRWMIQIKGDSQVAKAGDLVVFRRQTPAEKPQQTRVGSMTENGTIQIIEQIEATLPVEGRGVFLLQAEQ